ncbi:MAG: ribonuclease III [Candidatus Coatesbacteria bacterium]|nr:ribonuclease III [Candidatus Coatesbacteria bacterium]
MKFNDPAILERAITHTSYSNEINAPSCANNERMEFIGDAVLKLVVCDYLYRQYPNVREGNLTKVLSYVVSDAVLAEHAAEQCLDEAILLGKGEEMTGGRQKVSILAASFESVIAAIYFDQGLPEAARFIISKLGKQIGFAVNHKDRLNFKSLIQEYCVHKFGVSPAYRITAEIGPPHDRVFEVEILIEDKVWGTGSGRSKRDAEQRAARDAVAELEKLEGKSLTCLKT